MGLRFWRRVKILPGITVNLSKTGSSVSFGGEGAKYTVGRGGTRWTAGLPGTGLYYTKKMGQGTREGAREAEPEEEGPSIDDLLHRGWLTRAFTPKDELAFIDGLLYFSAGLSEDSMDRLAEGTHPDTKIPAGFLAMRTHRYGRAIGYLEEAWADRARIGELYQKYGLDLQFSIPVTPWMDINASLDETGLLFALVEAHQAKQDYPRALAYAKELRKRLPDSNEARLSQCELIFQAYKGEDANRDVLEFVLKMLSGIENEGPVESALLMYRARAMRLLGQPKSARAICQDAMRRKKDRPAGLLRAIRLERALCFRDYGQQDDLKPAQKKSALDMARVQLNHLYGETPDDQEILNALQTV